MKTLLFAAIIVSLSGCAVSLPSPGNNVIVYPAVRVEPSVEIVYMWDPIQYRYFWVDRRDSRHYMDYGWRHPHGHKPRGHDRWDRK